ncbi:MAG: HEAT repeat domain-containing protein [Phycisphaeraceae bacterium]
MRPRPNPLPTAAKIRPDELLLHLRPLLLVILIPLGSIGCSSGSYAPVYEGLFGEPPQPSPTRAVEMMFDRDDADRRRQGITALAASTNGGEPEYVVSYRLFVVDPDPGVRAAAAVALGMHGSVEDATLLTPLLRDPDALVGWQAADALRKIHNPEAVSALVERLDEDLEDDADTRAAAALALGQYPDRVAFARLVTALEQGSFNVVAAAHRSLTLLTGQDLGLDPQAWAQWFETAVDPFADQQPYTYDTYKPDRSLWDQYVTFWNNHGDSKGPRKPTGINEAEGG